MHVKDLMVGTLNMSNMVVQSYLGDLSDEELLIRPVAGQNHIAWQLGHLIDSERGMLESVKPGASPELPAGFSDVYKRDDEATRSDDASRFLSKAKYLELMHAQREATLAALRGMSDAELDAPAPERLQAMAPTAGAVFNLMGNHVLMHVGQFVSVRRKLNKPVAI